MSGFSVLRIVAAFLVGAATVWAAGRAAVLARETASAFMIAEPPFAAGLASIDREWNVSFKAAGKLRVVSALDLVYWGQYREVETGPHLMLADGGLVRADLLLLDEEQVVLGDATGLGRGMWDESTLPRSGVRGVLFQPPADNFARDRMWLEMLAHRGDDDRLLLRGGETLAGRLIAAPRLGRFATADQERSGESFEFLPQGSDGPLSIAAGRVVAVSFRSAAASWRVNAATQVWVGLADGSLVQAAAIGVKGDLISVTLAAGGELKSTLAGRDDPNQRFWDEVTYLECAAPRLAWLSDLAPLGYKHIPFLSVERNYGVDQSVLNSRLRAGGGVWRKGLGMPSASRLAYEVRGYRKFEALLAIDEAAGLRGSVIFKVLGETAPGQWSTLHESAAVRGGDAPVPVAVDLAGAGRLALLVEFADRGDECDYGNWLMARLLK